MKRNLENLRRTWARYLLLFSSIFIINTCGNIEVSNQEFKPDIIQGWKGLHGYIAYDSPKSPPGYGAGVSFYSAAWQLIDKPLADFQIGLPGTWIIPDNSDNKTIS